MALFTLVGCRDNHERRQTYEVRLVKNQTKHPQLVQDILTHTHASTHNSETCWEEECGVVLQCHLSVFETSLHSCFLDWPCGKNREKSQQRRSTTALLFEVQNNYFYIRTISQYKVQSAIPCSCYKSPAVELRYPHPNTHGECKIKTRRGIFTRSAR